MSGDETGALEAFERLGLTSYEAKVFIGLHRIGSGTARDVARAVDVPRSQVYGVAETLEERGLLEVQQSNPIRYRPVSVDEAREILRDRFETEQERAFEYVEDVRTEPNGQEEQEDIWTVRGSDRVDDRVVDLLSDADRRIVFGTRLPELLTDDIEAALDERAAAGVDVVGVSATEAVRERLSRLEGVDVFTPPAHRQGDDRSGRIVIVDDDAVLLSVIDDDGSETAIWSSGSLFASVLVQLIQVDEQTLLESR
ncbi:TrmB family transcriptional regulator [Halosolutus halophilus]|uniref:TrmB family transcriptional regulator n=1 Tax=Halosolutus halophilus TaxID=1552990 RepID=UPI002234F16D|nr:helix-turn-helix domain-containing protein [Halosolutus halophilus]